MQHVPASVKHDRSNGSQTRWLLVWALIFAGVVAAFQIGKAPIAIPLIRQELGLSLTFASWVIGVYAVVGAIAGLPAGLVINFLGARRSVIIGLLVIGAASCAGAFATSGRTLLLTRVLEGTGFLMVAIATPTLLGLVTASKDRDVVFGCWAVYFATGSVIVMLAGPLLAAFGWRSLWYSTGLLSLAYALVVWSVAPVARNAPASGGRRLADIGRIMRAPGPLLLALAFGCYSLQYHALTGLLPTLLVEQLGLSVATAGVLSAVTIIANGLGAVSAGFLLRQGIALWALRALPSWARRHSASSTNPCRLPASLRSQPPVSASPASCLHRSMPPRRASRRSQRCLRSRSGSWCKRATLATSSALRHWEHGSRASDGRARPCCSQRWLVPGLRSPSAFEGSRGRARANSAQGKCVVPLLSVARLSAVKNSQYDEAFSVI
jgi:MFS family permease